jgi:hypothetical protein
MSDDSSCPVAGSLEEVQDALRNKGFALTTDRAIGFTAARRKTFKRTYYNRKTLHHDLGDFPVDRKRARDVIRYKWNDDSLDLAEYDKITLTDRAGIPGKREHTRVMLLEDSETTELLDTLIKLVPPERRQTEGTFGVNLFRTYTNVVTKPHRDDEEYVGLNVIDRKGEGAESYLYRAEDVTDEGKVLAGPILTQQLNPGDIFIFEDRRFKHGATPLIPPPGGKARRDVLVFTWDYHKSYLGARELAATS